MKNAKYLSLLALTLLLVGCNQTPASSASSSSSSSSSSESSLSESSSSEVKLTQADVDAQLGDTAKLQALLASYSEKGVTQMVTSSSNGFSGTDTTTITFRTKECLISNVNVDLDNVTTSSQTYEGIVGSTKYYITSGDNGGYMSNEELYASEDDIPEDLFGAMTVAQAEEEFANTVGYRVDLTQSLWSGLFTVSEDNPEANTIVDSYSATLGEETISVRAKAHQNVYNYNDVFQGHYSYTYVAEFNSDFVVTSGTLTIDYYLAAQCDAETMLPLENGEKHVYGSSVESLESFTLGTVEETGSTPMIDLTPYFVSSLTSDAYISSVLELSQAPWQIESNPNEVFAGYVISDYDIVSYGYDADYNQVKYFLPTTALDSDSLTILSSSNTNVISYVEAGWDSGWSVSSDPSYIGTEVELTIGNSFGTEVGKITVTVAEVPDTSSSSSNVANINVDGTPYFPTESDGSFDWSTGLTINCNYETYVVFPTVNEAPFEDYSEQFTVSVADTSVVEVALDYETGNMNEWDGVAVAITPKAAGTTSFSISDEYGPLFSFMITVPAAEAAASSCSLSIANNTGVQIYNLYVHTMEEYIANSGTSGCTKYYSDDELEVGKEYCLNMSGPITDGDLYVEITLNGNVIETYDLLNDGAGSVLVEKGTLKFTCDVAGPVVITIELV